MSTDAQLEILVRNLLEHFEFTQFSDKSGNPVLHMKLDSDKGGGLFRWVRVTDWGSFGLDAYLIKSYLEGAEAMKLKQGARVWYIGGDDLLIEYGEPGVIVDVMPDDDPAFQVEFTSHFEGSKNNKVWLRADQLSTVKPKATTISKVTRQRGSSVRDR